MRVLKTLKKQFKRTIALVLTTTLTASAILTRPVQISAEEGSEVYVSDVMIYQGSLADAQDAYPDYTFVEDDLNKDGGGKEVHMGYLTTTEEKEAIRDLACMEMLGKYNTSDYDKVLEEQRAHLSKVLDELQTTIEEFRDNYAAGQQRAFDAYDIMNKYYEDDTGLKMGDFFLELDTNDEEDRKHYITFLLQADPATVNTLESTLASATDAGNTLWIDRLVAMGDNDEACLFDGLVEDRWSELHGATGKPALRHFDEIFHEDINLMNSSWEELRQGLLDYQNSGVSLSEDDEDTIQAYVDGLEDEEEGSSSQFITFGTIYEFLAGIEYGSEESEKQVLVDLFLKHITAGEEEEFEDDELIDDGELYAIIGSWTDGQRFGASTQGITQLLLSTAKQLKDADVVTENIDMEQGLTEESEDFIETVEDGQLEEVDSFLELVEEKEDILGEGMVEDGALSVYAGVDRSFFEGKIAMTSAATSKQDSSGEPAGGDMKGYVSQIVSGCFGLAFLVGGLVIFANASRAASNLSITISGLESEIDLISRAIGTNKELMRQTLKMKDVTKMLEQTSRQMSSQGSMQLSLQQVESQLNALKYKQGNMYLARAGGLFLVGIGLAMTLGSIMSSIEEYNKQKELEGVVNYTPIPDKMVEQSEGKDGMNPYLYYHVVKNQNDEPMDLNSKTSKHWLAVYTSKSEDAGRPILAENFGKICYGEVSGDVLDMSYLHHFGEYSAQNLVAYSRAKDQEKNPTPLYFFFERARGTETQTGSTFGNGMDYQFVMSALALAIGLAGGLVLGTYGRKKKENVA